MATLTHFLSSTIQPLLHQLRIRNGVQNETLSADATLSARSANFLNLDPGGSSRSVTLPAVADAAGLLYVIYNAGSNPEVLTVQTVAPATVALVDAGETAIVGCDGSTWFKLLLTSTELSTLLVDVINEKTTGAGVTIDGSLIKDLDIAVDSVTESTEGVGVTVSSAVPAAGAGTSGDVSLVSGGTTGAGVSGDINITVGTTTGGTDGVINLDGLVVVDDSSVAPGGAVAQYGTAPGEGWQHVVFEDTISPAAVETAVLTVPAGSIVDGVWAGASAALTGGGTTATWSLGITGDVDQYGTATADDYTTQGDSLAQNSKWSYLAGITPLGNAGASIGLFSAAAVGIKLIAAAAGGAAVGDTALTVGSVRIRVEYRTALPLADVV